MPNVTEPPRLVDRHPDTKAVLTESVALQLRQSLPAVYQLAPQWNLLYSLDQHGCSITTLYNRMKSKKCSCILAIKDASDQIFGAYLSETLKPKTDAYGTGECFLWKSVPPDLKTFQWTGRNQYMIVSTLEYIAVGGGGDGFGLWLHQDLLHGHSDRCDTYNNERLSSSADFDCIELEIWSIPLT